MRDVRERLKTALADRYTVQGELGRGGMAVVYLAEDRRHERRVAIKVLRPELASVVASERFLREIKLAAKLHHPHILTLLDSGEAEGLLYYIMPYVEGESLREKLNREGRLPVDEAVTIAREVADALSYAHARDLLHRDIKPENILLESGHAVVADFGIAKALSEAGGDRLTDTGVSIGTPAYMSPEQAAGERDIGEASDLYSLACVLYEMLAGETPITDPSVQKVVSRKLALADALIPEFEAQLQGAIGAGALAVARLHCWLGFQYAYLGDREAAFSQAEKCIDASPSDPFNYSITPHMLAGIYIRTGDYERAIDQLEIVQSVPNWWSVNWYRIDPMYAPLREHPRFQALLEEYELQHR